MPASAWVEQDGSEDEAPEIAAGDTALGRVMRARQANPERRTLSGRTRLSRGERWAAALVVYPPVQRPRTRAECASVPRPCPFVGCRHHLCLDINPESGSIKFNHPDVDPADMRESCALDVADRGGITLENVGALLGLTRERVRQLEVAALAELRRTAERRRPREPR
jgi:hypothetical protein